MYLWKKKKIKIGHKIFTPDSITLSIGSSPLREWSGTFKFVDIGKKQLEKLIEYAGAPNGIMMTFPSERRAKGKIFLDVTESVSAYCQEVFCSFAGIGELKKIK